MLSVSDMHFLSWSLSRINLWCSLVHLLTALFRLVFERDRLRKRIFETLSSIDHYILHKFIDLNVKKGVKVFIKTHKKKLKGPLPTLMQCSCLFLFWNKWHALFGQHSCLTFSQKEKIVRCISACVSSSEKWLHNLPTKSVNKYCFSWDAMKMQVTVFIFQICAVAIAFYCFLWNGDGGWWYFEQARFIESDSDRVFPWLPRVFDICIQKDQNNLFGMFAE